MSLKNIIAIIASVVFLAALGVFVYLKVLPQVSLFSSSALSVSVSDAVAQVYLNGRLLGTTPIRKEGLSYKKGQIRVTGAQNVWENNISLTSGTETAINLDLGVSQAFSGGDVVWLNRQSGGASLSIISDPAEVLVFIDDTEVGQTPLSLDVKSGAHLLKMSKDGFQTRSLNIMARDGYKLNVVSHLFLLPIPKLVEMTSPSPKLQLFNIENNNSLLSANTAIWAKAVSYWQVQWETSPSASLSYLVEPSGALFDRGGEALKGFPETVNNTPMVGYLSRPGEKELSKEAAAALQQLLSGGKKSLVEVLSTGQGWLRVRQTPDGVEIGRVEVGKTYQKVSVEGGWTQIVYEEGKSGWVSSQFVKEVTEAATP